MPRTALGYLAEALRRRRDSGVRPFSILSCDNLPENGRILKRALCDFAWIREAGLGRYVADEVASPCTMVDRIVPATDDEDRASLREALGLRDCAPVITEPFSQWVIEDHFTSGRPDWDIAGAQIVNDVSPHERMKLRLLNGAHTFLSSAGIVLGLQHVADAFLDPALASFLARLWQEAGETLPAGLDTHAYCSRLTERFRNRSLHHRLEQIAKDSSLKIPQRLLAPLLERRRRGLPSPALLLALATWVRFTLRREENGRGYDIDDPAANTWFSFGSSFDATPAAIRKLVQDRLSPLLDRETMTEQLLDDLCRLLREMTMAGMRSVLSRPDMTDR